MSLVNDLLIELDRQKAEEANDRSFFLEGMHPQRGAAKASTRAASALALTATLLFVGAGLAFVVSEIASPPVPANAVSAAPRTSLPSPSPSLAPLPEPATLAGAASPTPRLAVTAPESAGTPAAIASAGPTMHRIERVPRLSSITLEPRARFTRLRLGGDAGLRAEIDHAVSGRRLIVHLPKTRFDAPLDGLDLDRTPVAALTTRDADDGVSFEFELDRAVRIRTQERMTADASVILIDLTPAEEPARTAHVPPGVEDEPPSPRQTGAAMVRAPAVATPGIERSASDRLRLDRERARSRAEERVAQARLATSEGRLEDADRLTSEALGHLPDHPDALIARAELLATLERGDEALALVREARRSSKRHAGLAMVHARLLETSGRRDEAIDVLDRAGLGIDAAPELHALAAVYLQRETAHPEAIERFEAIVRRHPGEARWWMGLGISLEAMSRRSEAIDVYRIAMDLGALGRPSREWVSARITALQNEDD